MEKLKKCAAFFLAAVFLLPLGLGKIPAYATARSAAEALSWCDAQVGRSLDYDGAYGAQCVDFIYYYYQYLGVSLWAEMQLIILGTLCRPAGRELQARRRSRVTFWFITTAQTGMWLYMRMKI